MGDHFFLTVQKKLLKMRACLTGIFSFAHSLQKLSVSGFLKPELHNPMFYQPWEKDF